ncbi:MAG TPA: non-homologous end-joining DNA ligase [Luteitalea sp.]|nr:non-homologous end-joining DNA ligase [Luteitalea sp.]
MPRRPPAYTPQLATLVSEAPDDDAWLHEVKYDGFRMGLVVDGDRVQLLTRNGLDWTARFPTVVADAQRLGVTSALLDGEMAFVAADGRTSFQGLQGHGSGDGSLVYFVFDLLWLDGENLAPLPLEERKARLEALLPRRASIFRYSPHVVGGGVAAHHDACRHHLEGIICKRRDAPATAGRSKTWVKVKCLGRQEFVIGGFTDPQGVREGLGALLIGYYDGDQLRWAGKVGTGFTTQVARELRERLEPLVRDASPFTPAPRGAQVKGAHWVKPVLVGEVAFTEWTAAGKIRHPSFQGLRDDKKATQVVRERPTSAPARPRTAPKVTPARRSRRGNA